MGKDWFRVETDQLRALARVYDAQAYRLAGAVAVFSTVARPPADAFGILGPAHDAHTGYLRSVGQAVESLREGPFADIRTVEVIERELEVKDTGTKPSFAPLGHTGYVTTARKTLDKFL